MLFVTSLTVLCVAQLPSSQETARDLTAITTSAATMDQKWAALCGLYQRRTALIKANLDLFVPYIGNEIASELRAGVRTSESTQPNATRAPVDALVLEVLSRSQASLSHAISNLLGASQSTSNLRSNKAFQTFQSELAEIEASISSTRTAFIEAVRKYNSAVQTAFPLRPFFADVAQEKAPSVNFNFGNASPSATPH